MVTNTHIITVRRKTTITRGKRVTSTDTGLTWTMHCCDIHLDELVSHERGDVCRFGEKLVRSRRVTLPQQLLAALHVGLPLGPSLHLLSGLSRQIPSVEHQVRPNPMAQEQVYPVRCRSSARSDHGQSKLRGGFGHVWSGVYVCMYPVPCELARAKTP